MNPLTQRLPKAVIVDGVRYGINSDFRNCLKIIMAFEDRNLAEFEKQEIMLRLLFGEEIPPDLEKACHTAVKFLNCGEENNGKEESAAYGGRLYSFEKDAKFIFTAINQTHGIDLENIDYMHWWKFCWLFMDLNEDCFFSRMLYLRSQKNKGKLTREEWQIWRSAQDVLSLEEFDDTGDDETMKEFLKALNNGR